MRITASSASSRTTRARVVAVIPRTTAAPSWAAAAAVTPWAAATVPRAWRRKQGATTVGRHPAHYPRQHAPAEPGETRRTSVGLLGSKRRHVRLSGTGIRTRIKYWAPLPTQELRITVDLVAPPYSLRLISSGVSWKCALSRLASSITSPPPARLFRSNGHECRPHIPAVPLTRILSSGHVEVQPAASPAGTLVQKMAFPTTVGCKKSGPSHQPVVVAA